MTTKINWKVRVKNKAFWLTFIPAVLALIKCVCNLFGVEFEAGSFQDDLADLVSIIFVLLAALGVINDPTTAGLEDSNRAMTYEVPKED